MAIQADVSTDSTDSRLNENDYPAFKENFPPSVRRAMVDDDLLAGKSVSMLLASVVFVGVALAVLSVWLTLLEPSEARAAVHCVTRWHA